MDLFTMGAQSTVDLCPFYKGFLHCGVGALPLDIGDGHFTFVKISGHLEAQRAALRLIARGMITVPEAAQLAGVSRHLIRAWCKSRKISMDRARKARIARLWHKAMSESD
jgi:hypothetical protein